MEVPVYFVQCPRCGEPVEVSAEAVGKKRLSAWRVVDCDNCDFAFDYSHEEVQLAGNEQAVP